MKRGAWTRGLAGVVLLATSAWTWAAEPTPPTPHEQYLVELINRARAAPAQEARRFDIELNEGLPADTLKDEPRQPLAVNPRLTQAARRHSEWLLMAGTFSHEGQGGSTPEQRIRQAGYALQPPWFQAENIGWFGTTGHLDRDEAIREVHKSLFLDEGIEGRTHRQALLEPRLRELGAGVAWGQFQGMQGGMATTDFAVSGGSVFLTGVAYRDRVRADRFYTPGEGLGGVTVTATRAGDAKSFHTRTWPSGGYSLALPPGRYTVTAEGEALGRVERTDVQIGQQNVKLDFTPAP